MIYFRAFLVGGLICVTGQLLLLFTDMTSARILVLFVTLGVLLTVVGLYQPLVDFGGAGATVPLTGFGYLLAEGAKKAVEEEGVLGALTGGAAAASGGISAAIVFGYLASLLFSSKTKQ